MSLSTTLNQIETTLTRGERVYAKAHVRYAALAPYETVGAIRGAIARGSGLSVTQRDAILSAIITELQLDPNTFWQSLLLVTFTPMLLRLRGALGRKDSEDLDMSVLMAFLETARSLKFRSYIGRNLLLLTRERIFTERRRERRGPELELFNDETYAGDLFRVQAHARAAAVEVVRIIEAEGGEELRDVLLSGAEDESVKGYVDEAYADCDARARARATKRLRRARHQAFKKLRTRAQRREQPRAVAA